MTDETEAQPHFHRALSPSPSPVSGAGDPLSHDPNLPRRFSSLSFCIILTEHIRFDCNFIVIAVFETGIFV